jgi:hypothetical protein
VIPALQRYYGGRPQDWLEMPLVLLNAYAMVMPRLQAEDAMRMAEVVAVGTGNLEKGDSQRVQARWREALEGDRPASRKPPAPDFLALHGIGFKKESRTQGADKVSGSLHEIG